MAIGDNLHSDPTLITTPSFGFLPLAVPQGQGGNKRFEAIQ